MIKEQVPKNEFGYLLLFLLHRFMIILE